MLKVRVATALVLLAILLPAIFMFPPWVWAVVSLVLVAVAMAEWTSLLGLPKLAIPSGLVLAGLGAVLLWWRQYDSGGAWLVWVSGLLCLFWVVGGAVRLSSGNARGGGWPLALLLLLGSWLALVELREISVWALLSSMAVVWVADIAAYFAGRAFGRRKLAPTISPGKSWEGAIGGFVCAALYGVIVAWYAPTWASTLPGLLVSRWSWLPMAVVMIALAGLSVVGDLHESLLKRQAGVKDSGKLLPGHGGVLDRIDALIPVMPSALLLYQLLR